MIEDVPDKPGAQYIQPQYVLLEMSQHGAERARTMHPFTVLGLGGLGGAFITVGALFSILLATGMENPGVERLVEGLGFSTGFFFVILSGAALFTEANVVMPATMLGERARDLWIKAIQFWILAWIGNFIGAFLIGIAIHVAQDYPGDVGALLGDVVDRKMAYRSTGGVDSWFRVVLSGMLANWLVGMAAFFATMGRTIVGKYIPVFLAVTLFVSANFQHSPANMGFFSLAIPMGEGPGWGSAIWWNIIPAGLGNIMGGAFLVAIPLWYTITYRIDRKP